MNALWQFTVDDYLEICERAMKNGKKAGDSMEEEMMEYVKEKNIKPIGHTELNRAELIKEHISHGKSILNIDQDGIKIFKPKDKK